MKRRVAPSKPAADDRYLRIREASGVVHLRHRPIGSQRGKRFSVESLLLGNPNGMSVVERCPKVLCEQGKFGGARHPNAPLKDNVGICCDGCDERVIGRPHQGEHASPLQRKVRKQPPRNVVITKGTMQIEVNDGPIGIDLIRPRKLIFVGDGREPTTALRNPIFTGQSKSS